MRIFLVMLIMVFLNSGSTIFAAGTQANPVIDNAVLKPAAWLDSKNGNDLIMNPQEVTAFNKRMQADNMPALQNYPSVISRNTLRGYLQEYEFDNELYVDGKVLTAAQIAALSANRNLEGIENEQEVNYGIVVQRANLRSLPSNWQAFAAPADKEFDMWQETAIDPAEPVVILHASKDNAFIYVQMRNYRGWLSAQSVALTDRETWLKYVCPEHFAIVTDKLLRINKGKAQLTFQMGSRIPTEGENLLLPMRAANGKLEVLKASATYDDTLHAGYLPYTTNNLIRQAFKFLGNAYGWGGLHESVDCSSFVADVYRTVGVELPRNADEQETADTGSSTDLSSFTGKEKLDVVNDLPIGSALFMPNHVMLYLGSKKDRPYIIHALGSYGAQDSNGEYLRVPVMRVVVSDVFLTSRSGETFLAKFTSAQSFR